jgi:hypothetical protein
MLGRSRNRDTMFQTGTFSATSASRIGVRGLAKGSAAVLLASLLVATPVTATAEGTALDQLRAEDSDASIALDWQRTALRTIFTEAATPVPASALYLGFTSLAVDDAVDRALSQNASASAAAAVAAHDVLVAYFKASTTNLDADLATSLSKIPDGQAERKGIKLGGAAAATMVASRVDDGRNTQVSYNKPAEAGIWQPPASGMAVPWLGFVKPLVLPKPVNVDGPDPIGSAAYAADFNEVKRVGSTTSSERTAAQTDTANFFRVNPVLQLRQALLDHLAGHPLSLAGTTRMFAALDAATADALIQAWRLKFDIGYWRPFQAIPAADTDGNDATTADPIWKPLIETPPPGTSTPGTTPPYPDYVSGHACVVAAFTATVRPVLGDVSLSVPALVSDTKRPYQSLSAIENDAFMARIWLGIHFRDAMEDGYKIGHETGKQVSRKLA